MSKLFLEGKPTSLATIKKRSILSYYVMKIDFLQVLGQKGEIVWEKIKSYLDFVDCFGHGFSRKNGD